MSLRPKHKRLVLVVGALAVLAGAVTLVVSAMEESMVFFRTPTELAAGDVDTSRGVRLGGLVEEGSVAKVDDGLTTIFRVTDGAQSVQVSYTGLLPDLFREGQGVVTEGRVGPDGSLIADSVLAKHDENYMPPEVAEALERAGHPMGGTGGGAPKAGDSGS